MWWSERSERYEEGRGMQEQNDGGSSKRGILVQPVKYGVLAHTTH